MAKTRQLSEAEQKARAIRYGGMTRKEFNARHQRPKAATARSGNFEVVALFDGNPAPQTAPFPNEIAAYERFIRLSSNPNVNDLRVVENRVAYDADGKPIGLRRVTLFSLQRFGSQQFANSKTETLWQRKGGNSTFTEKQLRTSPKLMEARNNNELEIAKEIYYGGQPWWERRA